MNAPYWASEGGDVVLHLGDCLDVLRTLEADSIDAIVTDPPYGLEFMGREWDGADGFRRSLNEADASRDSVFGRTSRTSPEYKTGKPAGARIRQASERDKKPGAAHNASTSLVARNVPDAYVAGSLFQRWCEAWARECLRVLKPGGHMLTFGGTRTWHRLACGIEDAGFEIRDSIDWIYGSGFPKSLDVGKALSKRAPGEMVLEIKKWLQLQFAACGLSKAEINRRCGFTASDYLKTEPGNDAGGRATWHLLLPYGDKWKTMQQVVGFGTDYDSEIELYGRVASERSAPKESRGIYGEFSGVVREFEAPEDAARWEGWGTALKPGHEPIVVARKPLAGTVASNVLEWGTGAINVDGCRVGSGGYDAPGDRGHEDNRTRVMNFGMTPGHAHDDGRWPPNVLLGPVAAEELDRQSGTLTSGANPTRRGSDKFRDAYGEFAGQAECTPHRGAESGGASRFFPIFRYEAKAAASERPRTEDGTAHPTVKPVDLMAWLVRLVTQPGGLVLDPFAGSGTTAQACIVEGFRCLLIEKDPSSAELIKTRLRKPIQPALFGEAS